MTITITEVKEKQQILKIKRLEPGNVWDFCLKMALTDNFFVNRLIIYRIYQFIILQQNISVYKTDTSESVTVIQSSSPCSPPVLTQYVLGFLHIFALTEKAAHSHCSIILFIFNIHFI